MRGPQDVRALIESAGIPAAYRVWEEGQAPSLPYAVYYAGRANNFAADGIVYAASQRYTIEVYTGRKDPDLEARLQSALTAAGIFYTKDETYIDSERMHEIIYEIEV